ncbi:sugar phosphate isomerase/epimerase family protein [Planctomicrobium sp. SH664]|uniref:sugar phosphate isomerase/epimerase family protein n=1 Tax=Planctomicrobium sp. SH664 TaxID=3448125 RepID=UPI003F5B4752
MRLGISSYTFVWAVGVPGYPQPEKQMTPADVLQAAAELGLGVVQIADNFPLDQLSTNDLDRLADQARSLQIDLEIGTSGLQLERIRTWLQLAQRFQSPFLRVVLDSPGDHPTPEEAIKRLQRFRPEFERADVIFGIENHDRFDSPTLLRILEEVGGRHIGIVYDTANSIGCIESAERVLEVLGPHIINLHIKDYEIFRMAHNKGFLCEGRAAGQGQLKIPPLLTRLRELGRDPNAILELWPPPQATLKESIELEKRWARESVAYLRQFIPD